MINRFGPRSLFIKSLTTGNFRSTVGASLTSNNFQTVVPKSSGGNSGGNSGNNNSSNNNSASPTKTSK